MLSPDSVFAQRKVQEMDPQKAEQAQAAKDYEKTPWTDKLTYGGNFWFSFGSGFSQIYLQPLVGYRVTDKFTAGTGFTYIYTSQKYYVSNNQTVTYSDNVYGLNFFARHQLFGPLFAQAEYQPMNFTSYNRLGESKRMWTNALYLGGGLSQSMGGKGGFYMMVLYDVLWRSYDSANPSAYPRSFYGTAWNFRIGMMF
jgi:hypothetical protein